MGSLSLEVFKSREFGKPWSCGRCPCSRQGVGAGWSFPSNPNQSVLLWLCCRTSKYLLGGFVPLLMSLALPLLLSWLPLQQGAMKTHSLSHKNFLTGEVSGEAPGGGTTPTTSHITLPKSVPDGPRSPTAPVPPSSKQCKILQRNKRQEKELSLVLVIFLQRKNWEFEFFSNGPWSLKIRG